MVTGWTVGGNGRFPFGDQLPPRPPRPSLDELWNFCERVSYAFELCEDMKALINSPVLASRPPGRPRGQRFLKGAIEGLFNFGKNVVDTGFNLATGVADEVVGKIEDK